MLKISNVKKLYSHLNERLSAPKAGMMMRGDGTRTWDDRVAVRPTDKKLNNKWSNTARGTVITTRKNVLIDKNSKVFAMGSCFAVEIRNALREKNFTVLPRYFDIKFDPARESIGNLPQSDNLNYYNTFTIRQEFERAFANGQASQDSFWAVTSSSIQSSVGLPTKELYQDPLRKRVFAGSLEEITETSRKIDSCMRDAIMEADIFIITLGLTEVWRDKKTGQYICMAPGRAQMDDVEFVRSDIEANLGNMRAVCSLIQKHRPGKPVILTVSPVSLERTFTENDIVVANMESKSILRAVAAQIGREFDNVHYWPSYEIAMREDMYEEDGRHVLKQGVSKIITAFLETHCR